MQKPLWVTIAITIVLSSRLVACSEKGTQQETEISTATVTATVTTTVTATVTATATSEKSSHQTTLKDLETIEDLKAKFNEDFGKTRLILLFSPT